MIKAYAQHKPSENGLMDIASIRECFSTLHKIIEERCPHSRERSLALTNLEEAGMWATKAITHNDPESEVIGVNH